MKSHVTETDNVCPSLEICKPKSNIKIATLIYDGSCRLCCTLTKRGKESLKEQIDFVPSQELDYQLPDVLKEEYQQSIQWVDANGNRHQGAEAILHCLALKSKIASHGLKLYKKSALFRGVAESTYAFIAKYRMQF